MRPHLGERRDRDRRDIAVKPLRAIGIVEVAEHRNPKHSGQPLPHPARCPWFLDDNGGYSHVIARPHVTGVSTSRQWARLRRGASSATSSRPQRSIASAT